MIFIFELFIICFILFGLLLFWRILQNIFLVKWRRKGGKKETNERIDCDNKQEDLLSFWVNLNKPIKSENHKNDYSKVLSCLVLLKKYPNSVVIEKVNSIIKGDFFALIDNYVLCFNGVESSNVEVETIFLENYSLLASKVEVIVKTISENAIKEMKIQNKYLRKEID